MNTISTEGRGWGRERMGKGMEEEGRGKEGKGKGGCIHNQPPRGYSST